MPEDSTDFIKQPFLKKYKKPIGLIIGFIFVAALAIIGWQIFKKPAIPARFSLEAQMTDTAGISPQTTFVLKSTQSLNEKTVKKILKFEPAIDFDVKEVSWMPKLISSALAQIKKTESVLNAFEIKPAQALKSDEIYQAVISDPQYADREYSWAFQVKAPFQVVQTHPRDKGTGVPINSGIEIVFNRENLINPHNYFEISPRVEGTFEQYGNTFIFLPSGLAEKTVYAIKVKKGLKSQGSEDILEADFAFVFETGEKEYSGGRPYFDFRSDFMEFIPEKKPAFNIYYYNVDPNNLEVDIFKLSDADEFLNSYQESRQWDLGWTYFYRNERTSSYQPPENKKIISFKPEIIRVGYENFIEVPQVLEKGYYVLDVKYGDRHRQAWLQITPLSRYFSITHDRGILWLYDFIKKEPIVNSAVSFFDKAAGEKKLGSSNQDGLLEFATPDSLKEENKNSVGPKFFKAETKDQLPFLIKISDNWGYQWMAGRGERYWSYLSTDRYTYQMNDTVRYWGVAKGRDEDIKQKKIQVGIYSGYQFFGEFYGGFGGYYGQEEKPLVVQEILISQFDTVQGELPFKGMSPGFYTLVAKLGDEVITSASFEVLTYTKPAYQISVTASRNAIFAGETVDFKIKANFFDGTPVAGLVLEYHAYWHESVEGELTLNENGEGSLFYTPEYRESDRDYYPRNLGFTFSPKLSEEGEIWGSSQVLVFGPSIYIQASQEKKGDNTYQFTSKLNRIVIGEQLKSSDSYFKNEYIGEPVANYPIEGKIIKITYLKVETGQYYDPIDKVVRKQYRYDRHEETVEKLSGTTNQAGEWSLSKTLPKEEGSLYKIVFFGRDERARKFETSCYIYYSAYQEWKEFAISLNINNESYEKEFSIGDKIKLELEILEGEKPTNPKVLFYGYQNNISRVAVQNSLAFEEIFENNFIPSMQYRAVILGPYGFEETNSVTASFKEQDNSLTVDIAPEKESYRPQEEVKINLAVKDKDEKPVAGEVNISVVDEALFHILPYNWQAEILSSLYRNIYLWPLTGSSQYAFLKEALPGAGAEAGGCFGKGTPILMSDGSAKPIEKIKVGDEIFTLAGEDGLVLKPAIVQGISQHLVNEYLIINDSLEVTPEHKMLVNASWQYAGNIKIGDNLKGTDGFTKKVYSIKTVRGKSVPVYNIVVGKYHTYFAGGYFVHNQEKGGAESARANFVDVALFKTVQTDNNGQTLVSFKAPDNITAWRTTAIAFSSQTLKAGQSVKLIKTSLPIFVDVTLNNYYLAGDNPYIRLRAFGDGYKANEPVELGVKSSSLNLDRKENSTHSAVYLQLGQLREGEYEITASVKQGSLRDSLVRKIKVVKNYFRKAESPSYNLTENLSDIQGNKDGFTELVFMDAGRGRFYPTLWWHTYLGGIRADQITAQFLAQKLLAQYFNEPQPEQALDLSGYHTSEGGLGLFPYSDSDLELSAKIADLAPEYIFQERLKSYFNQSLKDKKSDIHRLAKALYGLAALREPVLVKLNLIKENQELNLEDKIYLALAFAKLGDKESARDIYEEAIKNQLRFQGGEAWLAQEQDITKRVKLSGTIGMLTSYLNIEEDADSLWNYINEHNPERELDILEETLLIKSELARTKDEEAKFSYKTDTKSDSIVLEKGRLYSLTLSEEELKSIKFSNIEGKIKLVSFYERSKDPAELAKNSELGLTRNYFVNNQPTNSFNEGSVVLVKLDPDIAPSAIDGAYQVIDYLPSGLKPITRTYEKGLSGGSECEPIWYPAKIIDNIVYFQIYKGFDGRCAKKTINYYARVVSKGNFSVNPAVIQSLKDLESLNISSQDSVEIK